MIGEVVVPVEPPARVERGPSPPALVTRQASWRTALLALVGAELLLLYAPTLLWLIDRWTMSVWHHAHGLFVPPLVMWFVHVELRRRPELRSDPGSAWGFALLIPALLLHVLDAGMHTQLLSAVSLVIALPGLTLLMLGSRRTKAVLFPLAFAAFALPIPLALTEPIHLALRHVAVFGTSTVLPLLGFPLFVEGTTLHLVVGPLEVGDACSGFSTLYASAAVACLTAYSVSSVRRRMLVFAAAAPIAIASNILRVTLLAVLVAQDGYGVLDTLIHPLSGMMTFALSLPLILWLGGPTGDKVRR